MDNKIIESLSDWVDLHGSSKGYREQWGVLKPELGKVYAADCGIAFRKYEWKEFEIVFLNKDIAVGLEINSNSKWSSPEYRLFDAKNGWKYQDARPYYRLQDLEYIKSVKEIKELAFELQHAK